MFEAQVARTPAAPATSDENGSLTFAELNDRANHLAGLLRGAGVENGTFVGLFLERSVHMVVATLAVLKAGGAYIPLDPTYPAERVAYMIGHAQLPLLLTDAAHAPALPEQSARVLRMDVPADLAFAPAPLPTEITPTDLAYVIFTSGSTGRPQGSHDPARPRSAIA
jgi:non-ribosomal peptide synthetase component F